MLNTKLSKLRSTSSEEGFTLIELMIVVVIIGILSAIAIPVFANQQKAAKDATLKSDMKNMALAVQTYYTKFPNKTNLEHADGPLVGTLIGWHVVVLGSPDARFSGTNFNPTKQLDQVKPAGFPDVAVSEGVGIGVVSTANLDGYCITGNAVGSSWDTTVDAAFKSTLYYDSKLGGIKTRAELTTTGACKNYV